MRMNTNNVYMSTPPMPPLSCFSLRTTAGVLLVAALVTQAQAQEAVSLPSVTVQSSPSGADMPARNGVEKERENEIELPVTLIPRKSLQPQDEN